MDLIEQIATLSRELPEEKQKEVSPRPRLLPAHQEHPGHTIDNRPPIHLSDKISP
jgi:hypothetical protein